MESNNLINLLMEYALIKEGKKDDTKTTNNKKSSKPTRPKH